MIEHRSTWGQLEIGSYMKDKTGVVWKVERERDGSFGVKNRAGEKRILKPRPASTALTVLIPTEPEATKTLSDVLGAVPEASSGPGEKLWRVRIWPRDKQNARFSLFDARAHLALMHVGYAADIPDFKGAQECHDECHADTEHTPIYEHIHNV